MAKKKPQPAPDEKQELDKAYWELTGYKFNQKKKPWLLWLVLLAAAAVCWYFEVPELIAGYFS